MKHFRAITVVMTFILNNFSTYLTWPQIRINSWLGLESRVLEPLEIGKAFDSKPMPSPLSARPCSLQCGPRLTGEANQWVDPDPQGGRSSGNGSRGCLGRPPGWRLLVLTPHLFSAFSLTASLPLKCPMHSTPKPSWDNREIHERNHGLEILEKFTKATKTRLGGRHHGVFVLDPSSDLLWGMSLWNLACSSHLAATRWP